MAATRAWLIFFGSVSPSLRQDITDSLLRAGVDSPAFDPDDSSGPGLLVFDEMAPCVAKFLREVSDRGLERILTIATTRASLAGGLSWQLLQAGASDVFAWDHSARSAGEVAARLRRWEVVDQLVGSPLVRKNCVGRSPAWVQALRQIVEMARFTNTPALITGETGTGKELAARLIHTLEDRPDKRDLVLLDCTTIARELSGSEFFGHERGAFTGALAGREGAFALADGGTLFLDEVGELPLSLQAELLRVVQEHTYKRVGSNAWQRTNFRLVCATNRELLREESLGQFRRDLYYRIAGWTCRLPPLRDRTGDILPLAEHFMQQLRPDGDAPELDEAVRDYLLVRAYPGNVRDLRHVVARMISRHVGPGPITVGDLPEEDRHSAVCGPIEWCDESFDRSIGRALEQGVPLKEIGRAAEDAAVRLSVGSEGGNLQRAARRLGVTDRALQLRRAARLKNGNGYVSEVAP
jgi:transcriptional regulator with GAF, ATPase, and Fis domain